MFFTVVEIVSNNYAILQLSGGIMKERYRPDHPDEGDNKNKKPGSDRDHHHEDDISSKNPMHDIRRDHNKTRKNLNK